MKLYSPFWLVLVVEITDPSFFSSMVQPDTGVLSLVVKAFPSISLNLWPLIVPLLVLVKVQVTFSPADKLMFVLALPSVQTILFKSQPVGIAWTTEYVPGRRLENNFILDKLLSESSSNEKLFRLLLAV